jgi:protein SCO1/2
VERKTLWVGIAVMALVGVTAMLVHLTGGQRYNATVYDPPLPAGAIELTDQRGRPYRLSDQRGGIVLVFFGYTHCPDVCPLTMARLRQVFEMLGSQSRDVQVLFVTTDPARDTPEQLDSFLKNFNPEFIGLTGTREELQKVWGDYGVTVLDEGLTHSSRVYVIDREGALRMTFIYETEPADMASDLRLMLRDQ